MESICIYPGNDVLPSWQYIEKLIMDILPNDLKQKINSKMLPTLDSNLSSVELDKPLPMGVMFGIECAMHPKLSLFFSIQNFERRDYLIDALTERIREDSEQEVLYVKNIESFWNSINSHRYYVSISSPASRVWGENRLMLYLAIAISGATRGYVYVTQPDFFEVPYGVYDFDTIMKLSKN